MEVGEHKGPAHPKNILFWNLNGIRARWNSKRKPIREVLNGQDADVVVFAETRCDYEHLIKMAKFEDWLRERRYHFCYFYWTVGSDKKRYGEGGMAVLSKVKPSEVTFGFGEADYDQQARLITVSFLDFILVGTYNPQGGFTENSLSVKERWEVRLAQYLRALYKKGKPLLWVGDFNVNPNADDWCQEAWSHLQGKLKGAIPAGCREVDVKNYLTCVQAIKGINLCEHFNPCSPRARTHFCDDRHRAKNQGQRIDHMVASTALITAEKGVRVCKFETLQNLGAFEGSSDHCPLRCEISTEQHVFSMEQMNAEEGLFRKQPLCNIWLNGQATVCLLDTGSGFTIMNPARPAVRKL
jgi:exodeoxyribonuclease III